MTGAGAEQLKIEFYASLIHIYYLTELSRRKDSFLFEENIHCNIHCFLFGFYGKHNYICGMKNVFQDNGYGFK
jgi:hypothetical protein